MERSEELMLSILIAYLADNFAITDHYHCAVDFWPWLKNFALVWKCANSIWFIKKHEDMKQAVLLFMGLIHTHAWRSVQRSTKDDFLID